MFNKSEGRGRERDNVCVQRKIWAILTPYVAATVEIYFATTCGLYAKLFHSEQLLIGVKLRFRLRFRHLSLRVPRVKPTSVRLTVGDSIYNSERETLTHPYEWELKIPLSVVNANLNIRIPVRNLVEAYLPVSQKHILSHHVAFQQKRWCSVATLGIFASRRDSEAFVPTVFPREMCRRDLSANGDNMTQFDQTKEFVKWRSQETCSVGLRRRVAHSESQLCRFSKIEVGFILSLRSILNRGRTIEDCQNCYVPLPAQMTPYHTKW